MSDAESRVQEAIHGLRQEARFFNNVADRLESAKTWRDLGSVYSSLYHHERGDEIPKDHGWAMVMLKDQFKEADLWHDEKPYPDYDKLTFEEFKNE